MNFVGILENVDAYLPFLTMEEYFSQNLKREDSIEKKIVEYLRSGICIAGVMNITRDIFTHDVIDGLSYHTDGMYIWPIYFPYYIEKYPGKVLIPSDFIEHLKSNDFKMPRIDNEREDEITRYFDQKWHGK